MTEKCAFTSEIIVNLMVTGNRLEAISAEISNLLTVSSIFNCLTGSLKLMLVIQMDRTYPYL